MSAGDVCRMAQNLARNCGWHVFPCRVADKKPCTPHGFKDASNDPARVTELWRRSPGGLVGIATGEPSGISVLDVDVQHDEARAWWWRHEHLLPTTRAYRTRRGGLHLYFKHTPSVRQSAV
jgi:Bifunctional DNA primase/polymerase, N-terminal